MGDATMCRPRTDNSSMTEPGVAEPAVSIRLVR
jgi:hypothetical protein